MTLADEPEQHCHDVVIVGAGLSGICTAWHLRQHRPEDDFVVLESRAAVGGTWDLFRYPGVRSDSDMPTLGYGFRPWLGEDAIADGARIRDYIEATADEAGIRDRIAFEHRLTRADWNSTTGTWTLGIEVPGATRTLRTRFLMLCTGYYDYDSGYTPGLPGVDAFGGDVIHPQHWPADFDPAGRRIAVIGSGATAVTLVPALCALGAQVTMVQRTPSFIAELPARDSLSRWCHRWLGARAAHAVTRWKNILYTMMTYQLSRRWPSLVRRRLLAHVRELVGDRLDVDRHFNPPYEPWDQRLCLAPDGDFFAAIRSGDATVETGRIDGFDAASVRLEDGTEVLADTLVTATGLALKVAGGTRLTVDGRRVRASEQVSYKGAMLGGIPNLAMTMGYINASWTLKCELIARWFVRLRNYMDEHGYSRVCPDDMPSAGTRPLLDLDAGYIRRAEHLLPRQGSESPWRVHQNYFLDRYTFLWQRIDDGSLRFSGDSSYHRPDAPTGAHDTGEGRYT